MYPFDKEKKNDSSVIIVFKRKDAIINLNVLFIFSCKSIYENGRAEMQIKLRFKHFSKRGKVLNCQNNFKVTDVFERKYRKTKLTHKHFKKT